MRSDVFISHSTVDKKVADAICTNLESHGIRCWIAPRDIAPGADWAMAINDAIKTNPVFVLVFSEHSNSSIQVAKEITLAVNNKRLIIPFKIDASKPTGSMEYYLSDTHWLDAIDGDMQKEIDSLRDVVSSALAHMNQVKEDKEKEKIKEQPKSEPSNNAAQSNGAQPTGKHFCGHCGFEMKEGDVFCTNCGSRQGAVPAGNQQTPPRPQTPPPPQNPPRTTAQNPAGNGNANNASGGLGTVGGIDFDKIFGGVFNNGTNNGTNGGYNNNQSQNGQQNTVYNRPQGGQQNNGNVGTNNTYNNGYNAQPQNGIPFNGGTANIVGGVRSNMTFGDAVKLFFKNYANFKGRSVRREYWFGVLFNFIASCVLAAFANVMPAITVLGSFVLILPGLSLSVRRLHDVGKSGKWLFFALVPYVGWIYLIYLFIQNSGPDNRWGARPGN